MNYIDCDKTIGSYNVSYLKIGTIAYAKMADGSIRLAKCVAGEFIPTKNYNLIAQYTWKIAGLSGLYLGSHSTLRYPNDTKTPLRLYYDNGTWGVKEVFGVLYPTEFDAQHGSGTKVYSGSNALNRNATFSILNALNKKYGVTTDTCCKYGTYDNLFSFTGFRCAEDGQICSRDENFTINITANGAEPIVPNFDNHITFPTAEMAVSAFTPKKVITFDDEELQEEVKIKKVKITIEIEETQISALKNIATICK